MKTLLSKLGLVVVLTLAISGTSFARTTTSTTSIGGGNTKFGLGFSTYGGGQIVTGTLSTPALSGWLDLGSQHSIQMLAAINGTSPFQFAIGGIYRYSVLGDNSHGLHVGLGFNLGTVSATGGIVAGGSTTSFFMNIFPQVGFHFDVLSNIRLAFSGGPVFAVTPSPFQFYLQTNSLVGGGSIHYFF